jgi:CRP-like cAMP-binding protein
MTHEKLTELLKGVSFSADLPDEMLRKLARISQERSFPAGTILFEEGTHNNDMYLIWSGRVALDMQIPGHGNVRILSLGPGDVVAWSALLELGEMTASAVTTEECETVVFPADLLLKECRKDHEIGYEIMRRMARQLARRLLATRLQLADLLARETTASSPASSEKVPRPKFQSAR